MTSAESTVPHITAITFTLLVYLLLGAAYYGWGRVASWLLGFTNHKPESPVIHLWLGWALTLFIFQVVHFFLPITAYVTVLFLAFGVVFSIPQIRNEDIRFPALRSDLILLIVSVILALGIGAWVASRAMLPPTNYDSGLYHFNAIRWINTYPIVPGLGNLHGRLAFNQSFFTYVAALNFYPVFGYGRSLANSFLLLLVLATVLPSMVSIIRQPSLLIKEHPFRYASDLFILPIVTYLALSSDGIASPSPDLASTLLQLAMFIMLAHGIAAWINGQRDHNYMAMVLVVLAATAVTIKLSNLAFSAVIIGFALAYTWQTSRAQIKAIFLILLPAALIILVWGFRGVILSGAPLYPSTIGYMPMEWAVPIDKIINEANWVYSWARMPGAIPENVLGRWNWFYPWIIRIFTGKGLIDVVYPLTLTACFCILAIVAGRFKKVSRPHHSLEWAILLPSIIGLIYWFFTAPDPRFANAIFLLALICSILLFLLSIQDIVSVRMFITTICIIFLLGNVHFVGHVLHPKCIQAISTSGWHAVKELPLDRKVTSSGLAVFTPKAGDQCWDSPLPCTPYFNDRLRLINSTSMTSGFTVIEKK